jgi:predicted DNA-binding transcriptional regulator YafY
MVPDGWTLEKTLGYAWRMMRGSRRYRVRIRFDSEVARNVSDTLWHPTQLLTWEADGQCVFECQVDGLDEIIWWVLGYGAHARVLEPAELAGMVRDTAQKMCGIYDSKRGKLSSVMKVGSLG